MNLKFISPTNRKSPHQGTRPPSKRLAEIMKDAEKEAPFDTMTIGKGLPLLSKNLKWILEEIQEKANVACKESKGAATEEFNFRSTITYSKIPMRSINFDSIL